MYSVYIYVCIKVFNFHYIKVYTTKSICMHKSTLHIFNFHSSPTYVCMYVCMYIYHIYVSISRQLSIEHQRSHTQPQRLQYLKFIYIYFSWKGKIDELANGTLRANLAAAQRYVLYYALCVCMNLFNPLIFF